MSQTYTIEAVPRFISDCCSAKVYAINIDEAQCGQCREVCNVIDTNE